MRTIGRWQAVGPTIDEGSNAYGSEEVEHYAGESPTMVSDHCLELVGCSGVQE